MNKSVLILGTFIKSLRLDCHSAITSSFTGLRANNESLPKYADKLAEKIEQRQKQSKKKFQPNR